MQAHENKPSLMLHKTIDDETICVLQILITKGKTVFFEL